jgi:fatty-acyl-CoA synthase
VRDLVLRSSSAPIADYYPVRRPEPSPSDANHTRAAPEPLWTMFCRAVRADTYLRVPLAGRSVPVDLLLAQAERTATQVLQALGTDRLPRRIGVVMANGEPWVRSILAIFRLGVAAVPLALPNAFGSLDRYLHHLFRVASDAQLDVILVDESIRRILPQVRAALPGMAFVDVTDAPAQPASRDLPGAVDPGQMAVLQYTSGSTSEPKGVMLTQANVVAGLDSLADGVAWTVDDSMAVWLPLFHDMGLFLTLSALSRGSSVHLWRPGDFIRRTRNWLESFGASRATAAPAPNFAYERLTDVVRQGGVPDGLDLSAWRIAYNGAESVHLRTIEEFQTTFGPYGFRPATMFPCYGLAEATLVVTFPVPGAPPRHRFLNRFSLDPGRPVRDVPAGNAEARAVVSVGRVVPGLRMRIALDDRPVADNVVGEVQIRGPAVTSGYLGRPADAQPFTVSGWLRTGDAAFTDGGDLFLVGRIKEMVIVRGQNFYPEDVEDLVRATPGVDRRHCAALGVRVDDRELMLVLLESSLAGRAAEELAARVRTEIVSRLGLDAVEVLTLRPGAIPFTSSGKVRRRAARQLYERHELGGQRRGWSREGG